MLVAPTTTRSPPRTRLVAGTGSPAASSGWAMTTAPVAEATSGSACQWSQCWWVVTMELTGVSPMSSSSRSASLAASISTAVPVWVQRSR